MKNGIPFTVKLRAYIYHAIIAAISLVVFVLVFLFLAEPAAVACADVARANDAPHSEVIVSGARCGKDGFYYITQYFISGTRGGANASCDILMAMPNAEYGENCIYFTGNLEEGTCAVSANIAARYGLNVGDSAKIVGKDLSFTVVSCLPAQSGLDEEKENDGVIVLAYDSSLLDRAHYFISFSSGEDVYPALENLYFMENRAKECLNNLMIYAAVALAAFALDAALCEIFLYKAKRRDYAVFAMLGRGALAAFARVWTDGALKYLAPFALAALCFIPALGCYGLNFALPVLVAAGAWLLMISVYSFITVRGLYLCRAKAKIKK